MYLSAAPLVGALEGVRPPLMGFCFEPLGLLGLIVSIEAGRMPQELVQLFVLLQLPLELQYQALVELLAFGERDHQLVAVTGRTPIPRRYCGGASC